MFLSVMSRLHCNQSVLSPPSQDRGRALVFAAAGKTPLSLKVSGVRLGHHSQVLRCASGQRATAKFRLASAREVALHRYGSRGQWRSRFSRFLRESGFTVFTLLSRRFVSRENIELLTLSIHINIFLATAPKLLYPGQCWQPGLTKFDPDFSLRNKVCWVVQGCCCNIDGVRRIQCLPCKTCATGSAKGSFDIRRRLIATRCASRKCKMCRLYDKPTHRTCPCCQSA